MVHRWNSTARILLYLALLVAVACNGTSPDEALPNLSGTWDAHFDGTVVGRGTSQNDDFTLELTQSGSNVTGTVRFSGLDLDFPLTGAVAGNRFEYRSSVSLAGCELRLEADTVVEAGGSRWSGTQTQSSCEGTAEGRVEATRR